MPHKIMEKKETSTDDKPNFISGIKKRKKMSIVFIIVIILILTGVGLSQTYWNISLKIELVDFPQSHDDNQNITIKYTLKNTGFSTIGIVESWASISYNLETPNGTIVGPQYMPATIPMSYSLYPGEIVQEFLTFHPQELSSDNLYFAHGHYKCWLEYDWEKIGSKKSNILKFQLIY